MGTKINMAYGVGGPLVPVMPTPILAERAPTSADNKYPQGQDWFDNSQSPPVQYVFDGESIWSTGGNADATTSSFGIVQLATLAELQGGTAPAGAYVPTANDVATVIAGVVVGAVPPASETQSGIAELATQAETNTGTDDLRIVTPLKLTQLLVNAPPAIGTSNAAAGQFTTLGASGLITGTASATITTGATALNLASDASTGAVNIGTGAGARAITIGNVTGATAVTVNTGTGNFAVNTTGAGDIVLTSADTVLVDSAGVLELNSSAGVISIGNDAVAQNINIGTGAAARTITIGNTSGATALTLSSGTGAINIGTSVAKTITIGNQTGATSVVIDSGTGAIDIGTAIAKTITIGNTTGATGLLVRVGTGNYSLDGAATSTYTFGPSTTSGTINFGGTGANTGTMTIAGGTGAQTLNIANSTGGKTINLGAGAGANVITIGSVTTTSGIALLVGTGNFSLDGAATSAYTFAPSTTSGTINFGGTGANTGTATILGGTGAQTINIANSTGGKTINIGAGAGANVITIGSVTTTSGIALLVGTGNFSLDGAATSAYTFAPSTTSGTINFGGTGANTGTMTIAGGTGAQTINIANSTGGKTVNIAAGAGANVVTIGSVTTTSGIALLVGTGNFSLDGAATSTYTFAPSTTSGTINFGGTGANTGTATILGGTGAQTINLANNTGIKTINIAGDSATSANVIKIGTGAGAQTLTIGSTNTTSALTLQAGTGGISLSSGQTKKVTTVAAAASPYAVLGSDYFINTDTTGGVLTLTLPAAPATGRTLIVYDGVGQAAANTLTIDGNGKNIAAAGTSAGTKTITTAYASMTLTYNGTLWCGQKVT